MFLPLRITNKPWICWNCVFCCEFTFLYIQFHVVTLCLLSGYVYVYKRRFFSPNISVVVVWNLQSQWHQQMRTYRQFAETFSSPRQPQTHAGFSASPTWWVMMWRQSTNTLNRLAEKKSVIILCKGLVLLQHWPRGCFKTIVCENDLLEWGPDWKPPQANLMNLFSWSLILTSVPARDPPCWLAVHNDPSYVGVSLSGGILFMHIIWATSAILSAQ